MLFRFGKSQPRGHTRPATPAPSPQRPRPKQPATPGETPATDSQTSEQTPRVALQSTAPEQPHNTVQSPADPASTDPKLPRYQLRGLDGIRALAALAVLVYHVAPNWLPGGFLGVDVFFVLSGFLITALLAREKRLTGRINIAAFWLRRFRRLVPAVTLTVLVTVPLAAVVNRDFLVGIWYQVLGTLTYTYNWVNVAFGGSYFDRTNPQFLANMWTLAVEQQFYLVWPLILLLAFLIPTRHRWLVPAVLVLASVSEMAVLKAGGGNLTRIYEGTDTHAFGLMLGATLALLFPLALENTPHYLDRSTARLRGLAAWVGMVGVFVSFLMLRDSDPFTYPWGVLAVSVLTIGIMQACLEEVAGVSGPGQILVELLSWPPLQWLGVRSYSLYLWHWPVFMLVNSLWRDLPQWAALVIIAVVSILAASLSYKYVENPMRRNGLVVTWKRWFAPRPQKGVSPAVSSRLRVPWRRRSLVWMAAVVAVLPLVISIAIAPEKTAAEQLVAAGANFIHNEKSGDSHHPKTGAEAKPPAPTPQKKPTTSTKPSENSKPISGDQVDIIGDSVTLAAAPKLAETLPGATIDAAVSRSSAAGVGIMRARQAQGTLRPYVVFALATNSTFRARDGEALLAEFPQTKFVFVTGHGRASQEWIQISNQTMYALAGAHPDRVKVASWDSAIAGHVNLLASDEVHPGPAGQDIYAATVHDALQQFATKPAGRS
ncbi:acyltransferase family protein [uncultured Mobiluncus sp.]|uniref:acyltransferase family protein n=1 Tax=uncultured Mobiluncus sp. TaxID=293425 RepID=UPI00262C3ADF|nr:acyltransferase family protein [uncultured Mobiluncus sp.]